MGDTGATQCYCPACVAAARPLSPASISLALGKAESLPPLICQLCPHLSNSAWAVSLRALGHHEEPTVNLATSLPRSASPHPHFLHVPPSSQPASILDIPTGRRVGRALHFTRRCDRTQAAARLSLGAGLCERLFFTSTPFRAAGEVLEYDPFQEFSMTPFCLLLLPCSFLGRDLGEGRKKRAHSCALDSSSRRNHRENEGHKRGAIAS